ncbi:ATP-grasp domain-containing protein [Streptosporangium sp. LJ11]|uniref:ATP-grasp domain-containing protein n=1 Tax=Streptosporangium sp. LJ11 TaxID=3436927 RepID=UPI003F7A63BB
MIWYRRANLPQNGISDLAADAYVDVVNQSCTATLHGLLDVEFSGTWVSDPDATRRAENKLVQLRAAGLAGFKVPRTLVSQDPEEIMRFYEAVSGNAIMKPVRASRHEQLLTMKVTREHLLHSDALRLCPTIFQEYVPGSRHLRVLCCGSDTYAVEIESQDLDWRPNLDVPFTPTTLDPVTIERLHRVLELLNLRMGIFDLKICDGEPVWLEVNPQGQFLFLEGLTGMELTHAFAEFLYVTARRDMTSGRHSMKEPRRASTSADG